MSTDAVLEEIPGNAYSSTFVLRKLEPNEFLPVQPILTKQNRYYVGCLYGCGCGFKRERPHSVSLSPYKHTWDEKLIHFLKKMGVRFNWETRAAKRKIKLKDGFEKLLGIVEQHTTVDDPIELFCLNEDVYYHYEHCADDSLKDDETIDRFEINLNKSNWRNNLVIDEGALTVFCKI